MLPTTNRLPASIFSTIFRTGKRIHSPELTLIVVQTKEPISRFGFVVSKKTAKRAVDRNRIKRILRESIHHLLPTIPTGLNCVFIAKQNFAEKHTAEIEPKIKNLLT